MKRSEPPILSLRRERVRRSATVGAERQHILQHPRLRPVAITPQRQIGIQPDRHVHLRRSRFGRSELIRRHPLHILKEPDPLAVSPSKLTQRR